MAGASEVVLITGGNGFLGQHLIKLLRERDADTVKEIRCVDLVPFERRLEYDDATTTRVAVRSFVGDICQPETIDSAFVGVDCVFHCAAHVNFQFPPDLVELQRVNVTGTQNIIDLCRRHNVARLVFTSSAAVTLQPYMGRATFALVINQSESKVLPPATDAGFLVPGYPASKLRAEELVLAANGTPLADGSGVLATVALRPTVMYGEEDPRFVPTLMRVAHRFDQRIPMIASTGGKQQLTYAGNVAWAHIRAKHALATAPAGVGGQPVFVTDDTPVEDTTRFCQRLSRASAGALRLRPTWWSVPTVLTYFVAVLLQLAVRWWPAGRRLPFPPCGLVMYAGSIILFSRLRAAIHLDYEPIFGEEKAIEVSARWYGRWYGRYVRGADGDGDGQQK